ncbi:MAG: hypothetical protein SNJ70_03830 [Armatimonadota bacterium]
MTLTKRIVILVIVVFLMTISSAFAQNYELKLLNNSAYKLPAITGKIWLAPDNAWTNVYIGPVWISVKNTVTNETWVQRMLCVDPMGRIYPNQTWNATLSSGIPSAAINQAAWDRAVYIANNNYGWDTTEGGWNANQLAAIQISVWETLMDSTFNLGVGNFKLNSTVNGGDRTTIANLAQGFYNDSQLINGYASQYSWFSATTNGQDMYFIPVPSPTNNVVPEIPAFALAPMGLAAFGLIRRKINR